MKIVHDLAQLDETCRSGALTIGNFDGVHRGHAQIVNRVRALADHVNGPSVVLTFDPHPARLLRPDEAPPPLTWPKRKAELLGALGIDVLIAYPTNEQLLQKSPQGFFQLVLVEQLHARAIAEGPNFFFGHNRQGDIGLLKQLCASREIVLEIVEPIMEAGQLISSSRVRKAIRDGQVDFAARMLTQPYSIRGMVTHGARRGTTLGFPTANLDAIDTLIPGLGVYAGKASTRGRTMGAAINIGPNPTFDELVPKVEVHLIDYHESIYGEPLMVQFHRRLRDIRRFDSLEELREQLHADVAAARK